MSGLVACLILPTPAISSRGGQTLTANDGTPDAKFGISVAASEDTLVVGAPDEDLTPDGGEGAAYVFMRDGGQWKQTQRLSASEPIAGQKFGFSAAMSGDTLVIGGQREPVDPGPGKAYVFTRTGDTWSQQQELTSPDSASGDAFGIGVAVYGDTALVASGSAVYAFTRTGESWDAGTKLTGAAGAAMGGSISLFGDTAVIGASSEGVGMNPEQGAVYVFTRSGTKWTERAKLTAPDGGPLENFGNAVDLSGSTLVVGAFFDDIGVMAKQGSAYVFTGAGDTWTLQAKLTASDGSAHDVFGRSVAIDGNTLVVGAQWDDTLPYPDHGSAYVFRRSGGRWFEQEKLTPLDPEGGLFGVSSAIFSNTILIGAGFADVDGMKPARGTAYVFNREGGRARS